MTGSDRIGHRVELGKATFDLLHRDVGDTKPLKRRRDREAAWDVQARVFMPAKGPQDKIR